MGDSPGSLSPRLTDSGDNSCVFCCQFKVGAVDEWADGVLTGKDGGGDESGEEAERVDVRLMFESWSSDKFSALTIFCRSHIIDTWCDYKLTAVSNTLC